MRDERSRPARCRTRWRSTPMNGRGCRPITAISARCGTPSRRCITAIPTPAGRARSRSAISRFRKTWRASTCGCRLGPCASCTGTCRPNGPSSPMERAASRRSIPARRNSSPTSRPAISGSSPAACRIRSRASGRTAANSSSSSTTAISPRIRPSSSPTGSTTRQKSAGQEFRRSRRDLRQDRPQGSLDLQCAAAGQP